MEQSLSWEVASCSAIQEFPQILWIPKAHYRVLKSLPMVPILSHIKLAHSTPSYLSKNHFNIVTYRSISRQRLDKHVPAETDSW
jgi:hypothetical protein